MKKTMREIVREGYEKGNFLGEFRRSTTFQSISPDERELFDKLIDLLIQKPLVLDFGCGNELPYDRYIVKNNCEITGIDI